MATKTITVGDGGKWTIEVTLVSQDQGDWESRFRVKLKMTTTPYASAYNNNGVSMSINGPGSADWSGSVPFSIGANTTVTVVDRTFDISHNSDGSLPSVTFSGTLGSTGTSTFGSGGTATVTFDDIPSLATVPPAPTSWAIEGITNTTVSGDATSNGNGGATVDQWQLRYRKVGTSTYYYMNLDSVGEGTVTGLDPDTEYEFWNRRHNIVGWSDWSARSTARTHDVPDRPNRPTSSSIGQTSAYIQFTDGDTNGAPILERQLIWNTSSTTVGGTTVSSDGSTTINDLPPGDRVYVFARARNTYGWSVFSLVHYFDTVAGAFVNVAGVNKKAVPYVKHSGVWKLARAYARSNGIWRTTE